jgi:hypothetical protein
MFHFDKIQFKKKQVAREGAYEMGVFVTNCKAIPEKKEYDLTRDKR